MSELSHDSAARLIYQGHLSDAERLALRSHLRTCASCRRQTAVDGLLYQYLPLEGSSRRPSPQFTAAYLARVARRSRRSQIMKPVYAVGGAVALALIVLAGWFIISSNLQTTGLVEAPQLPAISVSGPRAALDDQLVEAVRGKDTVEVEQLLQEGASADAVDAAGNPALYYAIIAVGAGGSTDMVTLLLQNGADADVLDSNEKALLALAAKNDQLEVVQLLLDADADVNAKFAIGSGADESPLIEAVQNNHVKIVELLIARGADLEQQESDSHKRPLHYAAARDDSEIIGILLENGADPSAESDLQWTPLFNAARWGSAETVQALVDVGAEVDALSLEGKTPMMVLIIQGRSGGMTSKMMLLLDNGADPNLQDNSGDTALHHAARVGKLEAIPILIEHGVDLTMQNNEGQTALDVAANDPIALILREAGAIPESQAEPPSLDKQFLAAVAAKDVAEIERLLEAGANPDYGSNGIVPLPLAAGTGEIEIVRILLEAGADVNSTMDGVAPDTDPFTAASALFHAAVEGHLDIVELLLASGADPNQTETEEGDVALHHAAWLNHPDIVKVLAENGAEVDVRRAAPDGMTPLHWAAIAGWTEVTETLILAGAEVNLPDLERDRTSLLWTIHRTPENLQFDMVNLLLDQGATPNAQDELGNTALHIAAANGDVDIVELLLARESSLDLQNDLGETALFRAVEANQTEVVEFLIEQGASLDFEDNEGRTLLDIAPSDNISEILRDAGAE